MHTDVSPYLWVKQRTVIQNLSDRSLRLDPFILPTFEFGTPTGHTKGVKRSAHIKGQKGPSRSLQPTTMLFIFTRACKHSNSRSSEGNVEGKDKPKVTFQIKASFLFYFILVQRERCYLFYVYLNGCVLSGDCE